MRDALPTAEVGAPNAAPPSDAVLVERSRAGDETAYAELFTRHRAVATALARRLAGAERADDLVSEAFTNVWRLLCDGRGPETGFRPYLLTAVRNSHLSSVRRQRREALTPDYAGLEDDLAVEDDHQARIDASQVGRAFRALPDRWRTVLWLSVVERRDHAEIARTLDITANAVGVLAFRAREGLREAYLAEHLQESAERACRDTTRLLPSYVRGTLTARRRDRVDRHLDGCGRCSAALLDVESINLELGALLILALPAASTAGLSLVGGGAGTVVSVGGQVTLGAKTVAGGAVIGMAVAAAVVAAVGLAHLAPGPAPTTPAAQVVAAPAERPDHVRPVTPPRPNGAGAPAAPRRTKPSTPSETSRPPASDRTGGPSGAGPGAREQTMRSDGVQPLPEAAPKPAEVPEAGAAQPPPVPRPEPSSALAPRLAMPEVAIDLAGTRATVTLPAADLSPGDRVVLTATRTLGVAVPAQPGWSCEVSADWLDGHLWATHTVTCAWNGAVGASPALVTEYGLLGTGSLTATVAAAADDDATDNTVTAPLG